MLLTLNIQEKSMGLKLLFKELFLTINEGDKVAVIGRNGAGKTTMFNMIAGLDNEYQGTIEVKKGARIIVTAQEHFEFDHLNAMDYVLKDVPKYHELHDIMENYPETMGEDLEKIHIYSDALSEFGERGYYGIEERILTALDDFEIDVDKAFLPIAKLSGGQKRFVELVRVRFAEADLVLLDEPTNHMDYWGKAQFIKWIRESNTQAIFVVTHDRDVLKEMNKIVELKDKKIRVFPGNYDQFLKQNSTTTLTQVSTYEESLKSMEKLRKQMLAAGARKAGASNSAPKILEERLRREYLDLKAKLAKPSVWIDQESIGQMKEKTANAYHKYKDRNIHIRQGELSEYTHVLLDAKSLSVGYKEPLFAGVHFSIKHGEKVFIKGRNGAGKSTLIRAVLNEKATQDLIETNSINNQFVKPKPIEGAPIIYNGSITISDKLRLGLYEQELDKKHLSMTLGNAICAVYTDNKNSITEENLSKLLSSYLFDPINDRKLMVSQLSGGQKARFQLIKMFANTPNLLVLDEPTNHLDLPSIEELEKALLNFAGAIIYVSHDSYFAEKMGGELVVIEK